MILTCSLLKAQVQVSKEPMHKKVLENKYIRLMNVWLQPGDTTMFHIHSTPSVFLHFSKAMMSTQLKGQDWVTDRTVPGYAWYRSFTPDSMVHRVSNGDTVPIHVIDVEIVSSYKPGSQSKPLPFTVLFNEEKAIAYRMTNATFNNEKINNRGPMIAELVAGETAYYVDAATNKATQIKAGDYFYIEPGATFYLKITGNEANMVLFEIK
jgi:quercetin dioxygenase-like cupin family protein